MPVREGHPLGSGQIVMLDCCTSTHILDASKVSQYNVQKRYRFFGYPNHKRRAACPHLYRGVAWAGARASWLKRH